MFARAVSRRGKVILASGFAQCKRAALSRRHGAVRQNMAAFCDPGLIWPWTGRLCEVAPDRISASPRLDPLVQH